MRSHDAHGETGLDRPVYTPESKDQPQLAGDDVNDETEAYLAREGKSGLGFLLDIGQRLAKPADW
jgi:hypothetical protein